jgi:hypothetical protein
MRAARRTLQDIAAEIVRRVPSSSVIRLSTPPTLEERLQLLAARLERRPIVIMPHKCATVDEWIARYGGLRDR